MSQMKQQYHKIALPHLKKERAESNMLALPRITKAVVNVGVGRALQDASKPDAYVTAVKDDIARITGQQPIVTTAKKSIASFKIREGAPAGLKVTLRGERMYSFLDRLVHVALPRSRDFRGIRQRSVDESGNLTIGVPEHTIFPEVSESKNTLGFEVTIVTATDDRQAALQLFRALGFPLQKDENGNSES